MAKYMRDALPNAIYLGMTGTPVSLDDRDTEAVFGTYVDVYDMVAAQEDEAIVPVSYESR
jgi:type I restriction enzyme R subunit